MGGGFWGLRGFWELSGFRGLGCLQNPWHSFPVEYLASSLNYGPVSGHFYEGDAPFGDLRRQRDSNLKNYVPRSNCHLESRNPSIL